MSSYENTINAYIRDNKRNIDPITFIGERKKTISDTFKLHGKEIVPDYSEESAVEQLPHIDDDEDLNEIESSFTGSLFDDF